MIFWQIFYTFFFISCFSFGGGYAMISLIQEQVVNVHAWLSTQQFLNILAIAEATPGPLAINTATFAGFQSAGILGAVVANLGLLAPAFIIIILLAKIVGRYKDHTYFKAAFKGLRPVVVALIIGAALTLAWQGLSSFLAIILTLVAIALNLFTKTHPILLIFAFGILGLFIY